MLIAGTVSASAQVLFDAALGSSPDQQGWTVFAPLPLIVSMSENAFTFDSRSVGNTGRGGLSRETPVALIATNGYALRLTLRVDAESHRSVDRSGVSLILLGADRRGIELAFWTDRIWTQADDPLFTHAEEGLIDTTRGFIDYAVAVLADTYTVTADGIPLLTGPLRDYTAFSGDLDVYEFPNFLFLGDDTTSAAGAVSIRRIELLPPPRPTLTIRKSSDTVVELSWPVTATDWTLEQSETVTDISGWQPVTEVPLTHDGTRRVDIPASRSAGYLRLRQ